MKRATATATATREREPIAPPPKPAKPMSGEFTVNVKVENVSLAVKTIENIEHRMCVIKVARDFDEVIAGALGGDAKQILKSLCRHGQEKAYISINRINAKATLVSPDGETATISAMQGVQAVCTAGKDSDDPPTIRLEFEHFYEKDPWAFYGNHSRGIVEMKLTPRQQTLIG